MKKRMISVLGLLSVVVLAVSGCSTTGKKDTASSTGENAGTTVAQTINVNFLDKLSTLDTILSNDVYSGEVNAQLFEGLYRLNDKNEIELGLAAEEPEVSEDGTVYTYKLRDAKWSNGEKITADDFVYTYQKAVNPATQSTNANRFDFIKNAAAIQTGEEEVKNLGVKAVDEETLELTLTAPVPYIKELLIQNPFAPQNKTLGEAGGTAYGTNSDSVAVSGPFAIEGWSGTNDSWTLVKNKEYWDADNVTLTEIKMSVVKDVATGASLFDAGDADITTLTDTYVKQYQDEKEFVSVSKGTIGYLDYNVNREVTGNVHVRKAIGQAIDKATFTKNVLADGSVALNGYVPNNFAKDPANDKEFRAENGDFLVYDKAAALKEWETAKKELGKDTIELELLVSDAASAKKTAEYLQSELQENLPGLTINVKSVPLANRLEANRANDFDFFFGTWMPDFADPINFLEVYQSDGGLNFGKYSNAAYDKGIEEAKTTLANEPEKRWEKMLEIEKIAFEEDAAVTTIFQSSNNYLVSSRVKNVYMFPLRYTNYRYAEVTE